MNANRSPKSLIAAAALGMLLGPVASHATDGVPESFDRMLSHQPGPAQPVTNADREADPLAGAMAILLGARPQERAAAAARADGQHMETGSPGQARETTSCLTGTPSGNRAR